MSGHVAALEEATIKQQCKVLRMPAVAAQCTQLAAEAVRDRRTHLNFSKRCWPPNWKSGNAI